MIEYHPISAKDQSRFHQFGKNVLSGIFQGYALHVERYLQGGHSKQMIHAQCNVEGFELCQISHKIA